jgi:hypothetical protein
MSNKTPQAEPAPVAAPQPATVKSSGFINVDTLAPASEAQKRSLEGRIAAAALREQAVRYELLANDGRYSNPNDKVAIRHQTEFEPKPLMWIKLPIETEAQANVFFPAGDAEGARIKASLIRDVVQPDGSIKKIAHLPIHWEEAKTLRSKFPNLEIVADGEIFRGASPRSLFMAFTDNARPKTLGALEDYSLKMHLSLETYNRLGGLGGNRDLDFKDVKIASITSHVCKKLAPQLSRYVKWQGEDVTMAMKLSSGDKTQEIGMIFRRLNDEPAIPGFGLYSPTTEPLPHLAGSPILAARSQKPRILAADAIEFYLRRHPGKTKEEAYVELFVDPLLDIIMSMAAQGMSMELHSQNFLMSFDPKTGATKHVTIRDLHGLNYDSEWRKERGMTDLFSLEQIKDAFPDMQQADLDAWFKRDGKIRDRYKMPQSLTSTIDFFSSMFWMNSLDSLLHHKYFDNTQINTVVERIKDRVDDYARQWNVDLSVLPKPKGAKNSFWVAEEEGVRGKILFRRAS